MQAAEPETTKLEFRLLGPLEAVCDGASLDLGPPKQRALLATLLLADGKAVSNARLIEAVWGLDAPPRAVSSVQAYVSRLRGLLATNAGVELVRQAPGYAVRAEHVDVVEFRRLAERAAAATTARDWTLGEAIARQALALWRGPLLPELRDEHWVAAEAVRLDEMRALCLESLVTGLLGQARVTESVDCSHQLVEEFPLRERVRRLAMIALYRAGRSPEALDSYRDYVRKLDEQLGLQPGPELRELQSAILRHDPALAIWPDSLEAHDDAPPERAQSSVAAADPPGETDRAAGGAAPIVGRDQELAVIDEVLVDIVAGRERWLLLTGPAGIGKTRLAEEAARRARERGVRIVWSNCPDDEGTPAWWPLRPLVRDLGGDPDSVFLPPAGVDADTVRFQVYEKVSAQLVEASCRQPVLVVVDDVQWLDAASSRWLTFVANVLRGHRVGIVLTMRDGEPRTELGQLLASFHRWAGALHISVPPLDAAAASALLDQVSRESLPASESFALITRTGSNPLLLTEYARLPRAERHDGSMPLAARGLLGRRLNRLSEEVLSVLRAAAVIGDVFELGLVADVVGLSLGEVVDLLDAAAGEEIIMPARSGQGYQFTHALLREEVLLRQSVMRRQALHARVAEILARHDSDTRTLLRRAHHLTEALPLVGPDAVVAACTAAARDAERRWDWDIAAQQWAGALSALQSRPGSAQSDREELLLARLHALARAGRGQTVLDVTDAALAEAAAEGRTATVGRLAAALLRTSGAWPWAAYGQDPSALLARLTKLTSPAASDPGAHARVLAALAVGNCYAGDQAVPDAQSRQAIEIAEQLGDAEVLADALVGRVLTFVGIASHSEEAIGLLDRLHELPHAQSRLDDVLRDNVLTMALFNRGDVDGAAAHLREGIAGSDRLRLPVTRVQLRWAEATLAHWYGDLERAEELITKAHDLHRQTELYSAGSSFLAAHLSLLWDRGRVASDPDAIRDCTEPMVWGALAAAESAEVETGVGLIMARLSDPAPEYWYTLGYLTLLGHAAADLQDAGCAALLLERLSPNTEYLAQIGQTACVGPVALATGRLRAVLGDPAGALADLTLAERRATAARGRAALLRIRLARALLDRPGPERTLTLGAIADDADALGMTGVAGSARRAA